MLACVKLDHCCSSGVLAFSPHYSCTVLPRVGRCGPYSSRKWLHEKGRPACTDRLLDLAADVRRLSPPDHRDPDAFHIAKSGIADELRRVAHDAQQRLQD